MGLRSLYPPPLLFSRLCSPYLCLLKQEPFLSPIMVLHSIEALQIILLLPLLLITIKHPLLLSFNSLSILQ